MHRQLGRSRARAAQGYRRLLVRVGEDVESQSAVDVACRLAAERGACISAVAVVEVPALLPLDAHLGREEEQARRLLERASATGDTFGVKVVSRVLRARTAGTAILDEARASGAELIVLGTARQTLRSTGALALEEAVRHVLGAAPCRVLLVAARADGDSQATVGARRAEIRPAA